MAYWINHLMGNAEIDPALESLTSLFDELDGADEENTDVSLTHETEWSISAFSSGLVVFENVAGEGDPMHMKNVSKEKVIGLWSLLAQGELVKINEENWLVGYGS